VTLDDDRVSEVSRRLRSRCDAILGAVWFMPSARSLPQLAARVACCGPVSGAVAAALLAPMRAEVVRAEVDDAWRTTDPATLLSARLAGATAFLADALDSEDPPGVERAVAIFRPALESAPVAGHPVFAGLRSLTWPGTPLGDLWRASDMVRERRGDSHRNAWQAAGFGSLEIQLLTERWRTRPNPGSTTAVGLGWPAAEIEGALDGLRERQLVHDGGALTDEGRHVRDEIELATDRQERPLVAALGADSDELLGLLTPWAQAVVPARL